VQFVEVAVDSPVGSGRTFSYSVPTGMRLMVGQSVFVPFGSQSLQGIIFQLCDTPQVEQVRPVERLIKKIKK
jgi:primosomal protein N'